MDRRFLLSILDPRELVSPFTPRRAYFYILYALIIGGLVAFELTVGWSEPLTSAVRSNILPLMIFLYGFEPLLFLACMLVVHYPPKTSEHHYGITNETSTRELTVIENTDDHNHSVQAENAEIVQSQCPIIEIEPSNIEKMPVLVDPQDVIREKNKDLAIIITAHNSAAVIKETLESCLAIVYPQNIYVIDNGNNKNPPDDTPNIVYKTHKDINYFWFPVGNKTYAQYIACLLILLPYVLAIDDDVHPQKNFVFNKSLFEKGNSSILYPILAIPENGSENWLTEQQNLEYKIVDFVKKAENKFYGPLYPHGAVVCRKRTAMLKILQGHDGLFIAEDMQGGILAFMLGMRQSFDVNFHFPTLVPRTCLGSPLNLYQQRVRSWNIGIQTLVPDLIHTFFIGWYGKPSDIMGLKLSQFYTLYSIFADWSRLFVMIVSANDWTYWVKMAAIIAAQQIMAMIWHYGKLRHRPDLQQNFSSVSIMFIYRILLMVFTNLALLRFLAIYLPGTKPVKTISELEEENFFAEIPHDEEAAAIVAEGRAKRKNGIGNSIHSLFHRKDTRVHEEKTSELEKVHLPTPTPLPNTLFEIV